MRLMWKIVYTVCEISLKLRSIDFVESYFSEWKGVLLVSLFWGYDIEIHRKIRLFLCAFMKFERNRYIKEWILFSFLHKKWKQKIEIINKIISYFLHRIWRKMQSSIYIWENIQVDFYVHTLLYFNLNRNADDNFSKKFYKFREVFTLVQIKVHEGRK